MKTLTKSDLANTLAECVFNGNQTEGKLAAEHLVNILKDGIFNRETIYFPNQGNISVTVKNPRPVRNPKTCDVMMLPSIHSVTAARNVKEGAIQSDKLNTTRLTKLLIEHGEYSVKIAESIRRNFYWFVSDTIEEGNRIEIRGLGAFNPKFIQKGIFRNPRTGALVTIVNSRYVLKFKCSDALRKSMDKHYLC